jgi:hypothetical protein
MVNPMPNYRKKLIEVALPLDAINAESAREKFIRHGHPSTLPLWCTPMIGSLLGIDFGNNDNRNH